MISFLRRLFSQQERQKNRLLEAEKFCEKTWADCWAADAHEDELFYAYSALCRKQGRDFDYEGFFRYAGEHWRMDYDAYGYRKAFLEGRRHPSAITLDSLRPKVPPLVYTQEELDRHLPRERPE